MFLTFFRKTLGVLALFMLSLTVLHAQQNATATLTGIVSDPVGKGLPGVHVVLHPGGATTTTDATGHYEIKASPGTYQITFSHVQYNVTQQTVTLAAGATAEASAGLQEATYNLDAVTVTATATPTALRNLPSSVSIIKASDPEMRQLQNADDALNYVPGVVVRRMKGLSTSGGHTTVSMRGTGAANRTLVLKDGIPINDAYTGAVQEWNTIATNSIARIEAVRGPGSSLYGTNSMGGTINIVTETPKPQTTLGAGLRYGAMNTLIANAKAGKAFNSGFGIIGFAEYKQTDGYAYMADSLWEDYYKKSSTKLLNVNTKLSYQFKPNHTLEAILDFHQQKPITGSSTIYKENYKTDNYQIRYTAQDESVRYSLAAYYNHQDRALNAWKWNDDDEAFDTPYYNSSVPIHIYGFIGKISKTIHSNVVTLGTDIRLTEADSKKYYDGLGNQNFSGNQNFYSFFLNDDITLGKQVNATVGARYDHWENLNGKFYDDKSGDPTTIHYDKATSDVVSPKAGLVYRPTEQIRIRSTYAMGFKAPNMYYMYNATPLGTSFRLGNPELKPERMTYSIDLGADYTLNSQLEVSATYFMSSFKDFLDDVLIDDSKVPSYFDPGGLPVRQYINIGKVNLQGVEASVRYTFLPHTTAIISYFYNKSEIVKYQSDSTYEGNQLDDTPNTIINGGISYNHPKLLNVSVWVRHSGEYYADMENSDDKLIDPTTVVDIKASKPIGKFLISANVLNVFDLKYYGTYSSSTSYYYAQPRAVNVGVAYQL